ncbi:hypothetical protein M3Y95_00644000 [Aphelenchoides besseyi]|nr:hypothetical protein M3Y95_00644000 [Aphelenchoides besseyi]
MLVKTISWWDISVGDLQRKYYALMISVFAFNLIMTVVNLGMWIFARSKKKKKKQKALKQANKRETDESNSSLNLQYDVTNENNEGDHKNPPIKMKTPIQSPVYTPQTTDQAFVQQPMIPNNNVQNPQLGAKSEQKAVQSQGVFSQEVETKTNVNMNVS